VTLLQSGIRLASTIACAILIASFALFAIEKSKAGAKDQVNKVVGISAPAPGPQNERAREKEHGDVREAIDDANDVLIEPFSGVVTSGSIWAKRIVATLLALLVYGVILRILAAYLPGRR
jgi:hypothetical protein